MQYWIIQNGESKGPFTLEELKAQGITENTKIWCKDFTEWTYAKDTNIASELFKPTEEQVTEKPAAAAEPVQPEVTEEATEETSKEAALEVTAEEEPDMSHLYSKAQRRQNLQALPLLHSELKTHTATVITKAITTEYR